MHAHVLDGRHLPAKCRQQPREHRAERLRASHHGARRQAARQLERVEQCRGDLEPRTRGDAEGDDLVEHESNARVAERREQAARAQRQLAGCTGHRHEELDATEARARPLERHAVPLEGSADEEGVVLQRELDCAQRESTGLEAQRPA